MALPYRAVANRKTNPGARTAATTAFARRHGFQQFNFVPALDGAAQHHVRLHGRKGESQEEAEGRAAELLKKVGLEHKAKRIRRGCPADNSNAWPSLARAMNRK